MNLKDFKKQVEKAKKEGKVNAIIVSKKILKKIIKSAYYKGPPISMVIDGAPGEYLKCKLFYDDKIKEDSAFLFNTEKLYYGKNNSLSFDFIEKRIPSCTIKPKNLFSKIFWRFIKLDVNNFMKDNPLHELINREADLFNLVPKANFESEIWKIA